MQYNTNAMQSSRSTPKDGRAALMLTANNGWFSRMRRHGSYWCLGANIRSNRMSNGRYFQSLQTCFYCERRKICFSSSIQQPNFFFMVQHLLNVLSRSREDSYILVYKETQCFLFKHCQAVFLTNTYAP